MTVNSNNVRVARTGEWYVGEAGSTAPTNATTLPTGFVGLGALSEDGSRETPSRSIEALRMWQNGAVARNLVTESGLDFSFTMLETKVETVELARSVSVTRTADHGTYVVDPSQLPGRRPFIFDVIDGAFIKRTYIPEAEIGEPEEITYASGEPIGYGVTLTAYWNAGISGFSKVWDTALKTV